MGVHQCVCVCVKGFWLVFYCIASEGNVCVCECVSVCV